MPSSLSTQFLFLSSPSFVLMHDNRYEQLTISAASLREELHTEVEKILNDVIKFKIHVQGRLEEFEIFVADEVERETEVLQRAEIALDEEHGEVEGGDWDMVDGEGGRYND